jgi:hypothetical protein
MSDVPVCAKCRYLDLLERSLANAIYGEGKFKWGSRTFSSAFAIPVSCVAALRIGRCVLTP